MVETIPPGGTYVADAGRRPGVGYTCLVAAAVLFAINGTVSKVILDSGVSSLRLTELRCAGALAGLAVVLLLIAPERLRVSKRELPLLAAFGIAGALTDPRLEVIPSGSRIATAEGKLLGFLQLARRRATEGSRAEPQK